MLKVAKTAALILAAITPVVAVAQRSEGRPDRKPSPASSAPVTPQTIVPPVAALRTEHVAAPVVAVASEPRPATPQPAAESVPSPEPTTTVDYAHGQLTVLTQDSSLGAVLKLISAKTGAVIDLSPELQNEPVIAQIGPSAVREVLTALLDSPKIDYIIMGAGDTSGSVERIVVRTRQSFARTAMATTRPQQPRPQQAETEVKLDGNGHPAAVPTTANAPLTQEQLMENWKKIREEKRMAEIEQQRQDRENERNHVEVEPTPQPEPPPENPPSENPPLR